jgi:hypothetical protein
LAKNNNFCLKRVHFKGSELYLFENRNIMRVLKIIVVVLALIFAFYTPDSFVYAKIVRILSMAVFVYFLMRLMSKIPSKKEEDEN